MYIVCLQQVTSVKLSVTALNESLTHEVDSLWANVTTVSQLVSDYTYELSTFFYETLITVCLLCSLYRSFRTISQHSLVAMPYACTKKRHFWGGVLKIQL